MKPTRSRSMPLTAAMARFVDVADLIRSRAEVDGALRDLCDDYRLARQTLMQAKKEVPRPRKRIQEYALLVEELEDEVMRYLLGDQDTPTRE